MQCLVKLKPAIVNFLPLCTESTIVGFIFIHKQLCERLEIRRLCSVKFSIAIFTVCYCAYHCIDKWLVVLAPVMPMRYIKLHLYILVMPVLFAVIGFFGIHGQHVLGPFKIDRLSWLLAGFVMALGFIIQKFSMRYLLGDHHYRHYFPLFTAITSFASLAWMSEDLRLMALCWGITLLCLTLLMNVNRFGKCHVSLRNYQA